MNNLLKNGILDGRVILFLGAGASLNSKNTIGGDPPLAVDLAKIIAEKAGWEYGNESLSNVYSAAKHVLGGQLNSLLAEHYCNCVPSNDYRTLASIPWARVYTVNIDDAFEKALTDVSRQNVNIKYRSDRIEDKNPLYTQLEYVYLNGSIRKPEAGFVFSPEEYGIANAQAPLWYQEVASDYLQCTFVFIGTNIDESVFYHNVERYKEKAGQAAPMSYVLTPTATAIQKASFKSYGIEHIDASLTDFCNWLKSEIPDTLTPIDVAQNRMPELRAIMSDASMQKKNEAADLLSDITLVSRSLLSRNHVEHPPGTIRNFYKGFKPSWADVLDDVPAKLKQTEAFESGVLNELDRSTKLIALVGAAGSGKSTALMMTALSLADKGHKVYYFSNTPEKLQAVIDQLDNANQLRYYIFIERIDPLIHEISHAIKRTSKAIIVSAESKNIWQNRVSGIVGKADVERFDLSDISELDVEKLLLKIHQFGPWTRLGRMSESSRKKEIFEKSKRQLLIGLMEATTGIGFEAIIERDYDSIATDIDKLFFVIVCISTTHRTVLTNSIASRSIAELGHTEAAQNVAGRLSGIVEIRNDGYLARHPLYARKILDSVVDAKMISRAIKSLLSAFKVYPHPIAKNLSKADSILFKKTINHRFLVDVLRANKDEIFSVYSLFEKYFESDGLFWLQYGLSRRYFHEHLAALEYLQTAHNAFPNDHATHALAQQKLILAASGELNAVVAREYMGDAIQMLKKLDDVIDSDDTYPIVTMATGHIQALISIDGNVVGRVKAKEYYDLVQRRPEIKYDGKLQQLSNTLFMYAADGEWVGKR